MSDFQDEAQKNKFLRLMGAKKPGNQPSTTTPVVPPPVVPPPSLPTPLSSSVNDTNSEKIVKESAINTSVAQKINSDLERQYDLGMKMKGNRGGLGFS